MMDRTLTVTCGSWVFDTYYWSIIFIYFNIATHYPVSSVLLVTHCRCCKQETSPDLQRLQAGEDWLWIDFRISSRALVPCCIGVESTLHDYNSVLLSCVHLWTKNLCGNVLSLKIFGICAT